MMPQLRELELIECGVNDAGIIAMAGSPVFDQLTFFSVARSMSEKALLSGSCFWDGEYPSLGVVSHPKPDLRRAHDNRNPLPKPNNTCVRYRQ